MEKRSSLHLTAEEREQHVKIQEKARKAIAELQQTGEWDGLSLDAKAVYLRNLRQNRDLEWAENDEDSLSLTSKALGLNIC